jgi:hypothetical protein
MMEAVLTTETCVYFNETTVILRDYFLNIINQLIFTKTRVVFFEV